jgi:hypothetical protein
MPKTPLRQDLRWITREGSSCCIMTGAGESFLAPYVLAAGHSALASGQIATVPVFFGAVLQNLAPWALQKVGSVRTWAVTMAVLQALCLLILGTGAALYNLPVGLIFGLVSFYWAAGWSVGPAWNTWMDSVVPARLRARFFSRRNAFCEFVKWSTMMAATLTMRGAQQSGATVALFAGLFIVAGLARLVSAYCMWNQSEPVPLPKNYKVLGFRAAYKQIAGNPKARPLIYMLGAQFALQLAGPFIYAFLSEHKGVSWSALMLCIAAQTFSKVLVLPRLGRVAQQLGPKRLFRWSALGLASVPLLWLLPISHLGYYLTLQAYTGACIAAYEMGVTLVYLEAIPSSHRTSVLTRFFIFNTLAAMLGSSLGGTLLWILPAGYTGYAGLFVLASVLRLAALPLLTSPPLRREVVNPALTRMRRLPQHLRARALPMTFRGKQRSLRPAVQPLRVSTPGRD